MLLDYKEVTYDGKEYVVCIINYKDEKIPFVIDKDQFEKVDELKSWCCNFRGKTCYICHHIYIDKDTSKNIQLHNLVMEFKAKKKARTESVDHINRIGTDNRKENLRIVDETTQIMNRSKFIRKHNLQELKGAGINPQECSQIYKL